LSDAIVCWNKRRANGEVGDPRTFPTVASKEKMKKAFRILREGWAERGIYVKEMEAFKYRPVEAGRHEACTVAGF
jgi:hypothetical protein